MGNTARISPRERVVEKYLHKCFTVAGGNTYKWSSPAHAGVPDRICVLPDGRIYLVEVKREAGSLSRLQMSVHRELLALGCNVHTVYGIAGVDELMSKISENNGVHR
jgi:predicted transcriptional regulator